MPIAAAGGGGAGAIPRRARGGRATSARCSSIIAAEAADGRRESAASSSSTPRCLNGDPIAASAQLPPRLRDASAGGRRRSARDPGTARPRAPLDHAEVHAGLADRPDGGLRQGAPESLTPMSHSRSSPRAPPHAAAGGPARPRRAGLDGDGHRGHDHGGSARAGGGGRGHPRQHAVFPARGRCTGLCSGWTRWSPSRSARAMRGLRGIR